MLPQYLGMVGLVFCAVFWAITNRVEPLLVTTFGGLLVTGLGAEAVQTLRSPPPPPPILPDPVSAAPSTGSGADAPPSDA